MSPFENIVDAIHGLSQAEKFKLRLWLDEDLQSPRNPDIGNVERGKRIIGLFADEPDLMDRVMEAVYERRSRPLRTESRS
jgi:hypothetical protein